MAHAVSRFDRASARIAQPEPSDLIAERAEQIVAEHSFTANLATIRTADDMLGSLIDIMA